MCGTGGAVTLGTPASRPTSWFPSTNKIRAGYVRAGVHVEVTNKRLESTVTGSALHRAIALARQWAPPPAAPGEPKAPPAAPADAAAPASGTPIASAPPLPGGALGGGAGVAAERAPAGRMRQDDVQEYTQQ